MADWYPLAQEYSTKYLKTSCDFKYGIQLQLQKKLQKKQLMLRKIWLIWNLFTIITDGEDKGEYKWKIWGPNKCQGYRFGL